MLIYNSYAINTNIYIKGLSFPILYAHNLFYIHHRKMFIPRFKCYVDILFSYISSSIDKVGGNVSFICFFNVRNKTRDDI
jgi:hypothetical protein